MIAIACRIVGKHVCCAAHLGDSSTPPAGGQPLGRYVLVCEAPALHGTTLCQVGRSRVTDANVAEQVVQYVTAKRLHSLCTEYRQLTAVVGH